MKSFNIYLTGVGGQGIGLLSEVMLRAADHAGLMVKGVDTHGLAQRGGIVVSRLRFGENIHSPLILSREADLVVALERHETLRAINGSLKDGGTVVYYNTVWQPLGVRLGLSEEVSEAMVSEQCRRRNIREIKVLTPDLKNAQMQNIVVLARIDRHRLIPGVETEHYKMAMQDLMEGEMLSDNMKLFDDERAIA